MSEATARVDADGLVKPVVRSARDPRLVHAPIVTGGEGASAPTTLPYVGTPMAGPPGAVVPAGAPSAVAAAAAGVASEVVGEAVPRPAVRIVVARRPPGAPIVIEDTRANGTLQPPVPATAPEVHCGGDVRGGAPGTGQGSMHLGGTVGRCGGDADEHETFSPASTVSEDRRERPRSSREVVMEATHACSGCGRALPRAEFSRTQWERRGTGRCVTCVAVSLGEGPPLSLHPRPGSLRVHLDVGVVGGSSGDGGGGEGGGCGGGGGGSRLVSNEELYRLATKASPTAYFNHPVTMRRMCAFIHTHGTCKYGSACRYDHL